MPETTTRTPYSTELPPVRPGLRAYLWAAFGVAGAMACAFLLHRFVPHANLSLVFLTGVLIIAAKWGLGPSLFAGVASFLAFNFFFTTPFYTFAVNHDGDVATLLLFLITAALTGQLAARMHDEIAKKQAGIRRITALYGFAKRMTAAPDANSVLKELIRHLYHFLESPVAVLLPDTEGKLKVSGGWPSLDGIPLPLDRLEAAWKVDASPPGCRGLSFLTLGTARGPVGLVAVQREPLTSEEEDQARALCDQAAIAIERTGLVTDLEEARLISETEQLRSALLSSVSHDLRTPLSSIIGSSSTLLEYSSKIAAGDQRDLLNNILGEAERLNRYIQNLLDMTRLGHGGLELRRDWVSVEDIVAAALKRMEGALAGFRVALAVDSDLPLLHVHGAFVEQALVNILDNAIRFSPENGPITIAASVAGEKLHIDMFDDGPGIPEAEREMVFDMFYSVTGSDRHPRGTGLGLAICRGLIGAHGGEVEAMPGADGHGTLMRITLPLAHTDES
ncbi:DUF4118 domain-containing protein [Thiohalomonas denitrificans]|uniref:DUF4118 domain-containing protein n=1 Tax=Thiohalomonas denitrificans TaxID=415747 RepID=UPI0026F23364|nr:DUF4118 domain-containing protein [Thiohalomonas denitrificans]